MSRMNKNEPKYYDSVSNWQKFLQKFSSKKVTKKLAEEVKKKRESFAFPKVEQKPVRIKLTIRDSILASEANKAAYAANKRIQNWTYCAPIFRAPQKGDYFSNDEGRYSRSCKYTKYSYSPTYMSYVTLANGGRGLVYRYGFKNEEHSRTIYAPKGMIFAKDDLGLVVKRLSDDMDYHPTSDDLKSKKFATLVREKMATNFKTRLIQKQTERRNKFLEQIFQKDLKTTMVTLNDSRKAGNCIEGSLQFAERRLGIPRQEIINGGHLFHVRAEKLVKTGDERAIRAAKVAWQRETTVCI